MLSYSNLVTRVLQFLQDTAAATYDATETGYAIENELKRLSNYAPYFVDVIFQIESRTGDDTAGTASSLTDATKSQFLAGDATNEKVVHNTTDDTWAVVKTFTSTSVLVLTADIMDDGESYEIYNKRCKNHRQVYIGDMPPYLWVDSVEYPVGTERAFRIVSRNVLELDVDDGTILDSDSTLDTLNSTDVLVKFAMPQILCRLTDLAGAVHTEGAAAAVAIQVKSFTDAEIINAGWAFNIADQSSIYVVTTALTLANQATTGSSLAFYPGLEAVASADGVITFVSTTLLPSHEDLLERMVISRLVQSDSIRYANKVAIGGPGVMRNYQVWIRDNPLLDPRNILRELEALANPRIAKVLSRS